VNDAINHLLQILTSLPGIGRKSAQRIVFHLLKNPQQTQILIASLTNALTRIHFCPVCFNFTENELCSICTDKKRDRSTVCVVEEPADVLVVEQTGQYRGTYHVLGGVISPLNDIHPENLHLQELVSRISREKITEVIIATNPTVEGEATAVYIYTLLKPLGTRVTRIARGLPVGSDLELADKETIQRALEGRREM